MIPMKEIEVGRFTRQYIGHPGAHNGVIFGFHGLTQTAVDMDDFSDLYDTAQNLGADLYLPQGMGLANHWVFWNTPGDRDVKFFQALFEILVRPLGRKVVLIGFSAGSCLINYIGARFSDKVAGVVSYAGEDNKWFDPSKATNKFPVLVIRNQNDGLVGAGTTTAIVNKYQDAKHPVQTLYPLQVSEMRDHPWLNKWLDNKGHYWHPEVNQTVSDFIKPLL